MAGAAQCERGLHRTVLAARIERHHRRQGDDVVEQRRISREASVSSTDATISTGSVSPFR